jgi:DNA-binding transcriptional ArsR family regulator
MSNLDATFSALADPTRRAILSRLALAEATVMELAEPFEMTQPAISRHLKVLEGAGLIVRRIEGTKRPCRLAPDGIAAIDQWPPERLMSDGPLVEIALLLLIVEVAPG